MLLFWFLKYLFVTIKNILNFALKGLGTFSVSILYLQMTYKKGSESSTTFKCECCDYITVRKSQCDRHLLTAKHKILTNTSDKVPKSSEYICECGKTYKH